MLFFYVNQNLEEDETMETFTERAINIIKSIPTGTVMTYGQIAKLAGSPRGARQVVRILHSMSKKHRLPWHRVVNSKGQIGFTDDESFQVQKMSLESEGIQFINENCINLKQYQFHPDEEIAAEKSIER
jgi:methylated-DNA-protein-cysteine methyltransferase-like protein